MNQSVEIVILDDDVQYADLLLEICKDSDVNAEAYHSPERFLREAKDFEGVLILDLIMPSMDGIEVIRELALHNRQIDLVLISGFDAKVLHSAQQLAEAHAL